MANKIKVQLIIPERTIQDCEADMVTVPGVDGDFCVLSDHINFISMLRPGKIEIFDSENRVIENGTFFATNGFIEVSKNNVIILVEEVYSPEEFNKSLIDSKIELYEKNISDSEDDSFKETMSTQIESLKNYSFVAH